MPSFRSDCSRKYFQNELEEGDENFTASACWFDKWEKKIWYPATRSVERSYLLILKPSYNFARNCRKLWKIKTLRMTSFIIGMKLALISKCYHLKHWRQVNRKMLQVTKKSKGRLTILATSNASWNHKIKLVVIRKAAKPRAKFYLATVKTLSVTKLPVEARIMKHERDCTKVNVFSAITVLFLVLFSSWGKID